MAMVWIWNFSAASWIFLMIFTSARNSFSLLNVIFLLKPGGRGIAAKEDEIFGNWNALTTIHYCKILVKLSEIEKCYLLAFLKFNSVIYKYYNKYFLQFYVSAQGNF